MTATVALLSALVLQQAFFALLWLGAAHLKLARRAAWQWGASAVLFAGGMALIMMRGQISPWWSVMGGNMALLTGFVLVRRGVLVFAGRLPPGHDREQHLLLAAMALALSCTLALQAPLLWVTLPVTVVIAWLLGRTALECTRRLGAEFGVRTALLCAAPFAFFSALFALRTVLGLLFPNPSSHEIVDVQPVNLLLLWMALACGLSINAGMITLVVVRLVRRLRHASDHDTLTGVLNRRGMSERMAAEEARRLRHGGAYALLSVDIDHFKRVNDRYGHQAGDAVLVAVARAVRGVLRTTDSVGRMGGEEFCLLLPDTDLAGADQTAQRLMQALAVLAFPQVDPELRVSVSIGVVASDASGESLHSLQRRVDTALYAAKAGGRSRVVHGAAPVAT